VGLIHEDRDDWATIIERVISERLYAHGLQNLGVEFGSGMPPPSRVALCLYLGSSRGAVSARCADEIERATAAGTLVVPVIEDGSDFLANTPVALHPINAWLWKGEAGAEQLAHWVLEELGLEETQRRVFVSHRRKDSIMMAEQLHDALAKHRFAPFVDRFEVAAGDDVQERIRETLEDFAFLLLIESPSAHHSEWVFYEVDYALSHHMGVGIVRWPNTTVDIPGTEGLPRHPLKATDMALVSDQVVLTDQAMKDLLQAIERMHAAALRRRRRNLVISVIEAARAQGLNAFEQPNDLISVRGGAVEALVGVTPRLPSVTDLWRIDKARVASGRRGLTGIVVHAASMLPRERRDLLEWSIGERSIALVPQNAVGRLWSAGLS
jgi:hypothetical protein